MKHNSKRILFYASLLVLFIACTKADSKEDFGLPLIYMPQATFSKLRYNVPNTGVGLDSATRNYRIEADSIKIMLGVARSGKVPPSSYSVNVAADTDTAANLINNGVFNATTTMVLPNDIYSLPTSVAVAADEVEGTFYLTISKNRLKMYADKTVLIGVGITNPTKYSLSPNINKVIIIINVTALNL